MNMIIRRATLDDTQAISQLFRVGIDRWQRMATDGQVEDLPYEQLTIYERWLHGGAWMSIETGALWLSHLLRGAGLPVVQVDDAGAIVAYAEAYLGNEHEPFAQHLHIGRLITADNITRDALMQYLIEQAGATGKITASCIAYAEDMKDFYKRYGMKTITQVQQVAISAASGNVGFYKATEQPHIPRAKIDGWQMPIGRSESASFHWENIWANVWDAVPEIVARKVHRLVFNTGGQESLVCVRQQLYSQRNAEIYCWTPKALTSQLLAAIRDWAYRQGYRTLTLVVDDKIAKMLGNDVEATPYQQIIMARDV